MMGVRRPPLPPCGRYDCFLPTLPVEWHVRHGSGRAVRSSPWTCGSVPLATTGKAFSLNVTLPPYTPSVSGSEERTTSYFTLAGAATARPATSAAKEAARPSQ